MALTSNQLTNLNPEMLDDMAQGLNSLAYIAARFGKTEAELQEIADYEPMKIELARRKAVLEESGYTRKYIQGKWLQVLEHQMYDYISSEAASHTQRMEFAKYLRDSVEPKNAPVQQNAGSGYRIEIFLEDLNNGNKSTTITATAPIVDDTKIVDGEIVDFVALEKRPAFLNARDLSNINADLESGI